MKCHAAKIACETRLSSNVQTLSYQNVFIPFTSVTRICEYSVICRYVMCITTIITVQQGPCKMLNNNTKTPTGKDP